MVFTLTKGLEMANTAYMLEWNESERGWGIRPDGISLHPSREACRTYLAEFGKRRNANIEVPDCYDYPTSNTPKLVEVKDEVIEMFKDSPDGVRMFDKHLVTKE